MEIQTIENIKVRKNELKEKIKSLDLKTYKDQSFGSENEYSYKSLIGGIEALITDINTLLKSPSRFVKISTYSERTNIASYLSNISSYLDSPGNLYPQIDALKLALRPYNLRFFEDNFIEFENEINEARKIKLDIQEDKFQIQKEINKINLIKEEIEKVQIINKSKLEKTEKEIEELEIRKKNLEAEINMLESKNNEIELLRTFSKDNSEAINKSLKEVSSNEKVIKNFATNIYKAEEKLTTLNSKMEENNNLLDEYQAEREKLLLQANDLIESARQALKYTTAQGISESFDTQHTNSKGFWRVGVWLVGAIIFMVFIIGVSYWILSGSDMTTNVLIGRILMIPILSIGLYFCINQYNKQKTIIEDYAYKTVIAKAIVGFSEQIKKNQSENADEYVTYMKTALAEIHQDPLRKRDKIDSSKSTYEEIDPNKMIELFKRFAEVFKNNS